MNNGICAVVKRYKQNGKDFADWEYKPNDHYGIYDKMMQLTDNNHDVSADAASWCEIASIGEIYEFCEGEIEIMEID